MRSTDVAIPGGTVRFLTAENRVRAIAIVVVFIVMLGSTVQNLRNCSILFSHGYFARIEALAHYEGNDFTLWYLRACVYVRDAHAMYEPHTYHDELVALGMPDTGMNLQEYYPPTSFMLFAPLALFSHPTAFVLWHVLLIACIGVFSVCVALLQPFRSPLHRFCIGTSLFFFTLFSAPAVEHYFKGQTALVMLALVSLGLLFHARGRVTASASCIMLATMMKIVPGVLLLYFALRREWKLLVSAAVFGLLWIFLAIAFFGSDPFLDYLGRHAWPVNLFLSEEVGLCAYLGRAIAGTAWKSMGVLISPLLALLVLGLTTWVVMRHPSNRTLEASAYIAAIPLMAPYCLTYHMIFSFFPIALATIYFIWKPPRNAMVALAILTGLSCAWVILGVLTTMVVPVTSLWLYDFVRDHWLVPLASVLLWLCLLGWMAQAQSELGAADACTSILSS